MGEYNKNNFTRTNDNDKIKKINKLVSGIGGTDYLIAAAKRVREANRKNTFGSDENSALKALNRKG